MSWQDLSAEPRCLYQMWYCDDIEEVTLPFSLSRIPCDSPGTQNYQTSAPVSASNFAPVRLIRIELPEAKAATMRFQHVLINLARCGDCSTQRDNMTWANGVDEVFELPIDLEAGTNVFILETLRSGDALFSLE